MAIRQPLVELLRTGEAGPAGLELWAEGRVHPQAGQVPRTQRTVKVHVRRFHFTVHASAQIGLYGPWWNKKHVLNPLVGFYYNILARLVLV